MGIGYLLGGIACLIYSITVGYFGGIKKTPGLIKIVKMKLNKNMTDDTLSPGKFDYTWFRTPPCRHLLHRKARENNNL